MAGLGWVLLVPSALFCLAVSSVIVREGVDWRWERPELDFVRIPTVELGVLAAWWGLLVFAAVRRHGRRKGGLR
jgi:hypothetical protein